MVSSTLLALIVSPLCALASPVSYNNTRPTVTIDSGVVVGTITSLPQSTATVNQYLGIPFAAPPDRFRPPQHPAPWSQPYDASQYKPACIQQLGTGSAKALLNQWYNTPGPPAGESEDCLNLNVFTPASGVEGKAVLFWMFGGGFIIGSGSLPLTDGTSFAALHDVVVVTINYRVNVFGFPGSPDLPRGEQNLGFLDQRLALDWVQRNIAAFGGNPNRVTIFGESAGAGSVDVLVTTPPDPIPFQAAIMQSGQATIIPSINDSAVSWNTIVEKTGCATDDELECVRALPLDTLVQTMAEGGLRFFPVQDGGATWVDNPRELRLNSTNEEPLIARVPVLIGNNADETQIATLDPTLTAEQYLSSVLPPEYVQTFLDAYPLTDPGVLGELKRVATIRSESEFHCPPRLVVQESAQVGIDAWRYYFNASFPNSQLYSGVGAFHTAEIDLVFGTYPRSRASQLQINVSSAMQKAWADFAKDPTSGPGWEKATQVGVFGGGSRAEDFDSTGLEAFEAIDPEALDKRCELWQLVYDAGGF